MSADKDLNLSDLPGQVPEELAAALAGGGKGAKDGDSFWGLGQLLGFGEPDTSSDSKPSAGKDTNPADKALVDKVYQAYKAGQDASGKSIADKDTSPADKALVDKIYQAYKAGQDASGKPSAGTDTSPADKALVDKIYQAYKASQDASGKPGTGTDTSPADKALVDKIYQAYKASQDASGKPSADKDTSPADKALVDKIYQAYKASQDASGKPGTGTDTSPADKALVDKIYQAYKASQDASGKPGTDTSPADKALVDKIYQAYKASQDASGKPGADKDTSPADKALVDTLNQKADGSTAGGGAGSNEGRSFWGGLRALFDFGESDAAGVGKPPLNGGKSADDGSKPRSATAPDKPSLNGVTSADDGSKPRSYSAPDKSSLSGGKSVDDASKPRGQSALDKPPANGGKPADDGSKPRSYSAPETSSLNGGKSVDDASKPRSYSAPDKSSLSGGKSVDDASKPRSQSAVDKPPADGGKPADDASKPRSQSAVDKPPADGGKPAPLENKDRSKSVSGTQADRSDKPEPAEGKDRSGSAPGKLENTGAKSAKEEAKAPEKTKEEKFKEDVDKEVKRIPGLAVQKVAAAVYDAKAYENVEQAKKDGSYISTGSMALGEDVKPKAVTKTELTADGTTTTSTTKGAYAGGYAGAMAYSVAGGAGAAAAAGFESGYGSRTVVTVDRFGAESETIETWGEVTFKGGASAEAHANIGGIGAKVFVKTELSAEGGVKVTAYDPSTGLTYTKQGKVSAGVSADASAQALITWERMTVSAKAGAMAKADAEFYGSVKTDSGIGAGVTGGAGVWAAANAESSASVSWGAEGYKAGTRLDATVDLGAKLGIAPELAMGVSKLVVGVDALYGSVGAKVDLDMGYKEGKFNAKIDLKGALGLGYDVKLNAEVDVKKWGSNIEYNDAVTFKNWGVANYIPHVKIAQSIYSMFEGTPDVTYIESFWAPKVGWDQTSNFIFKDIPGVKPDDAAKFFVGALTQYARADFLQAEVKEWSNKSTDGEFYRLLPFSGEGRIFNDGKEYADAVKAKNQFFNRDGTDPASFTLTPGKNFVHDVSERLQKWFPGSQDPNVQAMELTFKKLPDRFDQAFRFKMDSNGKQQGIEPQSAFQIFAGLSLVQYLSVQAFEKIAPMSKGEVQTYLASSAANYITDEGKVKLLKLWEDSLPARILDQPSAKLFTAYLDGPGGHLTPEMKAQLTQTWQSAYKADLLGNVYQKQQIAENRPESFNNFGIPLDTADVRYEAKFWELAKSRDSAEVKQAKFKEYESQFKNDFLKKFELRPLSGGSFGELKVTGVPDNQLVPGDKIKFKGIPPSDNGYLIDLMPAKTGQIGLNDLIYKHTLAKLDSLKSPQAALQFLTGAKGEYIADEASRVALFKAWWATNKDGEWRTASDPDAAKARKWCDQNRELLSKYSGETNTYSAPKPLSNPTKPMWDPDNIRGHFNKGQFRGH